MNLETLGLHTDGSLATRCSVHGRHLEQTIGVNLKGGDELGLTLGHRWDAIELKLSEETVVFALRSFTFVSGWRMSDNVGLG